MGALRIGIARLLVVMGLGLAATATAAADRGGAGPFWPGYFGPPSIWRGLYGGVHLGLAETRHDDGIAAGVQLGYNWQAQQLVYGLEGDISLSSSDDVDLLASLRGRLGFLIQPSLLLYGTAGVGFVSDHNTDAGLVLGLGIEGMLSSTMSARLEYLSFDTDTPHADGVSVVRAGLNIKLGQ